MSLHETIVDLSTNKQSAKLSLYKSFSFTMGAALTIAFLFACYQLYYVWQRLYLEQWEFMWVLEVGFWQILYTFVFFVIMYLWKPSSHSKRYAFMQQIGTDEVFDELEAFDNELGPDHPDEDMEPKFTMDEEDEEEATKV